MSPGLLAAPAGQTVSRAGAAAPAAPGGLTAVVPGGRLTALTDLTDLTDLTRLTSLTELTGLTAQLAG